MSDGLENVVLASADIWLEHRHDGWFLSDPERQLWPGDEFIVGGYLVYLDPQATEVHVFDPAVGISLANTVPVGGALVYRQGTFSVRKPRLH